MSIFGGGAAAALGSCTLLFNGLLLLVSVLLPLQNDDSGGVGGGGGAGVRAQTNTLQSVSTFRQCNELDLSPSATAGNANGSFQCFGPTGYTVFVVNMKPGTGAGDTYVTSMDSNQFQAAPSDYALNPGADPPQQRAQQSPTDVTIVMSDVYLRYTTQLRPNLSPSGYIPAQFGGNQLAFIVGTTAAGAVVMTAAGGPLILVAALIAAPIVIVSYAIAIGESLTACNGGYTATLCAGGVGSYWIYDEQTDPLGTNYFGTPGLGLPGAPCNPVTSPETCALATFAEMGSPGATLSCGSCTSLGPGTPRFACNSQTMWWSKPLWRVYDIQPLPVIEYTVFVNLTSTSGATAGQSQLITMGAASGSSTRTQPCPGCTNVAAPDASGFSEFSLVAYSEEGGLRAEIIEQSVFGLIPFQPGIIVAADDPGGVWGIGYDEGPVNPRALVGNATAGEQCSGAAFDCDPMITAYNQQHGITPACHPRTLPNDTFCAPPANWFWGINFQNQVRFGNCCNCFGMAPDYWMTPQGATFACNGPFHSCTAGIDFWTSLMSVARPPAYFVEENLRFHRYSQNGLLPTAQVPFFMPQPACTEPGCQNVWMYREQLFAVPPLNTGVRVTLSVTVAGNFSELIRVLGTGVLKPVSTTPGVACTLTEGRQGSLFVDACNTGPVVADFFLTISCPSSTFDTQVASESQSIAAGQCFRANFQIGLSGTAIVASPPPCTISMYNAANQLLSTLDVACVEQNLLVLGPAGGTAAPTSTAGECAFGIPCWVEILIIIILVAIVVAFLLLCTCVLLRSTSQFTGAGGGATNANGGGIPGLGGGGKGGLFSMSRAAAARSGRRITDVASARRRQPQPAPIAAYHRVSDERL